MHNANERKEIGSMDKFIQLANDIVKLLSKYGGSYVSGIANTLILALVATLIGCLEPIAATVLSYLFLNTRFGAVELIGFAAVLTTVVLSMGKEN